MIRSASKTAPFARRDEEIQARRGTGLTKNPRVEIFSGWGPKL
jgi:hypothetical protein